jgi:DNA polymerase sigma
MNAKQRREYWRKVERLRAQLDNKYFNATKDSIHKQFKRFAKDIELYGVDVARRRLGLDLWEKELIKVFEDLYKEATLLFGNANYRALKIEANRKGETFGYNREWTREI